MEGKAASLKDEPIIANLLTGILEPNFNAINNVNSREIANSKGLDVSTVKHDRRCDYETLLTASIKHEKGIRTISGTLIGGYMPRIVSIQNIPIESSFPNTALYLRNYDKPGFIGDLGQLLGQNNINIASFHLGRREKSGEAIALVEIDQIIDEIILDKIKKTFVVAKDGLGTKPIYFYEDKKIMALCSELKGFSAIESLDFDENRIGLSPLTLYGQNITQFKKINQIEPGFIWKFNLENFQIEI